MPKSLTSLALTNWLPGRVLPGVTDLGWSFLATVTDLDLSCHELTEQDLLFLQPRLPPGLKRLHIAQNKFHTVVTPLPESLRSLKLNDNAALSDDENPDK
ncbi:hypothetical protein AMAG_19407 [Allomyces macrogynus ATCC 38327]|uniref:Uncharacterized protein n=1 Tax=Allomyces macrogynus (strain ATCC 38327) TaxID=578462 RepID=A0A0L0SR38_ALLM3|nr:hypothetical protein AMAG_19407 [Allomyces macrogynus ATCC 38327]|eukprot:KNE64983.1 hypothetical protein AMAG_19407 [Allomyces macrogynus ATCC 38327]